MRTAVLIFLFLLRSALIPAQETTFKTNGPDDYREGIHAFTRATIWENYNTKIDSGTLIIREGKIVDVGKNVTVPVGAIVHDMAGKFIYPSFIDIFSDYGMPEVIKPKWDDVPQMESNLKGAYGWNQAIHTDFSAESNFKVNDKAADEWRKIGFGTVLTNKKDGIARGTGTVVTLNTDKENLVILLPVAAAHYSFNKGSSTQDYPSSLMGSIALLRQTYYDAQWYKTDAGKKEYNIHLEAWNRQQQLPQIFDADGDWQKVLRADKIGDEFSIQYIIKTRGDEYQRIDEIKNTRAKMIVPLNFPKAYDVEDPYKAQWLTLAELKHWELAPTNCAALAKAEIDFAITAADLEKKTDFIAALHKAVKYGLDSTIALKALTYNPANFVQVYDKVGSLDKGKLANFFITSLPLFNEKCTINENWIQGKRYEIKPFDQPDLRGEYNLAINATTYKLTVSGEPASPKAQIIFNDSTKADANLTYTGTDISVSFSPDKKTSAKIRLNGTVDNAKKFWSGKGQMTDGTWVIWNASFSKANKPDTAKTKADTTDLSKDLGKVIFPFVAYGNTEVPVQKDYLLKNGTVWTNEAEGVLQNSDVLIRSGKIAEVGKDISCNACITVDASGKFITSGIIDEHNHIAIQQGVNEGSKASSAEVRIGDVLRSDDINMYRQLAGGVTAAQLLHGSANPIGGQSALVKFRWGYAPEKLKIEGADGFIKFALGENVKQSNWGDNSTVRYPQTRMGVEQTYYNYFTKAVEYQNQWKAYQSAKNKAAPPRRDLELDALSEILNHQRFITCHSYVQSEINMLIHVADSFHFKLNTFTHVLEGYKVADKLKAHGSYASTFADWWAYKYEVIDAIPYNAALLTKTGITTAINSDDAEMARRLNQEAAKTIKYGGLSEEEAWKTVTLNPAKMLHLDKKMGSLKAGKDADVVVWSANPLSIYAKAEKTFVDGILFFDWEQNQNEQMEIAKERNRIIQKMLLEKKNGAPTQHPVKKENHEYNCGEEHETH